MSGAASGSASTARDQVGRLLALVPYLHARGEVRVAEAAADLGVSAEQIVKDLRVLFLCGLPGGFPDDLIDVDMDALEGEGIIRVANADYLARPVRFSPSEATALTVALNVLAQQATAETGEVVRRVLERFEEAGASSAAGAVHVTADAAARDAVRAVLDGAIHRRHQVELTYHVPARDEQATRVVDPHGVVVVDDLAYLDAWCHSAQADRTFRVDRVLAARELDAAVTDPSREPRELDGRWFEDGPTTSVTLRLAPPAQWVPEYYPVTAIRPGPGGTIEVDLDVAGEAWLRQLWLRLAPSAEVVSPPELAGTLRASAQAALRLYQGDGVG